MNANILILFVFQLTEECKYWNFLGSMSPKKNKNKKGAKTFTHGRFAKNLVT